VEILIAFAVGWAIGTKSGGDTYEDLVAAIKAVRDSDELRELIVAARNAKAEMGLQKEKPSAQVAAEDLRLLELFRLHQEAILRLAGLEALNFVRSRLPAEASPVALESGCDLRLFYERIIDVVVERARLERDIAKASQQFGQVDRQLTNESFRSKAPQDVVAGAERRRAELADQIQRMEESLARLGVVPNLPEDRAPQP